MIRIVKYLIVKAVAWLVWINFNLVNLDSVFLRYEIPTAKYISMDYAKSVHNVTTLISSSTVSLSLLSAKPTTPIQVNALLATRDTS